MTEAKNKEINTIIDSIKLFSELGLQMNEKQKDECFRVIKYLQKQLETILIKKEPISINFDLSQTEIIIISHLEDNNQNKLIELLDKHSLDYFTFNSIQEFTEFIDDDSTQYFIFISEKIYNTNINLLKKYDNLLIFLSSTQNNNETQLEFYDSKKLSFNIKFNAEILELTEYEKSRNKFSITKYENLNILVIDNNSVNLRILTQFFKFMDIEFNAVKNADLGLELLKNNNFHAILVSNDLLQNESKALRAYLAKYISKDTLKVCIHDKQNIFDFDRSLFNEYIDNITNFEFFSSIFERYFYTYRINKKERKNKEKYYELFLKDLKAKFKTLGSAFEERDFSTIKSLTHNLKSGSGVLNETRLLTLLHYIDDSVAKENNILIKKNLKLFKDEIDRIERDYYHEYSTNRR